MTTKHFIKLSVLANFFDTKQLQRGENAVESGHIVEITPDLNRNPAILKGRVSASMKTKVYNVEIHIDKDDGIIKAKCECPRGLLSCHHMAALCIYARDNVSITDAQCSWNVPKRIDESSIRTLKDLYPPNRDGYVACKTQLTDVAVQKLKENMSTFDNVVGFTWLLSPEPTISSISIIKTVEQILYSEEFINSTNKIDCFKKLMQLSEEDITKVVEATVGQSGNPNWLIARKHRLTASYFGKVLSAYRLGRYPPSLFKSLLNEYNLEGVRAIQWGKENEPIALRYLEEQLSVKVSSTGLWLHTCGFLGASPDGFLGTDVIIEAKCPYKYRSTSLKDAIKTDRSYIIYEEGGEYRTNKSHAYYHQIQGQLYLTNRSMCFLVVWTPIDKIIHQIPKDDGWISNIDILEEFYLTKFIQFLLDQ